MKAHAVKEGLDSDAKASIREVEMRLGLGIPCGKLVTVGLVTCLASVQTALAAEPGELTAKSTQVSGHLERPDVRLAMTRGVGTELSLTLVASPDPVGPGEQIAYEMTVANRGIEDLQVVELRFVVPDHVVTFFDTDTGGDCPGFSSACESGETITFALGTSPAGGSRTVMLGLRLQSGSSGPPDGTLIHGNATVVHGGGVGAAASVDVEVDATPKLVLGMTEDRDPSRPGDLLAYRLVYGNAGVVALTGVALRMQMPVGTVFEAASGGGLLVGSQVEWSLGSLSVGEVGQQTVTLLVDAGLADGEVLTSFAAIGDSTGSEARAATATVVSIATELALTLVASPDPVRQGEQITYEVTVANRGSVDLLGVELRFLMPDHVEAFFDTDTGGDCPGFSSSCESGEAIRFSLGTLPAGGSRMVMLGLQLLSGTSAPPGGTLIHGSTTVVHGSGVGAAASVNAVVDTTPLLMLGMTEDRDPVGPGELLMYRLVYGNAGVVALTGVTLRARIPVGTSFDGAGGGGVLLGDEVEWTIGSLSVGEVGQQTLTVLVGAGLADGEVLTGYAAIGESAGNAARAAAATVVDLDGELSLTLVASPDPVGAGEQITYEMTVANRGTEDLAGVEVRFLMPDYVDSFFDTDTGGDCPGFSSSCESGETITFAMGTLPAGGSRTVLLGLQVLSGSFSPPVGALIHGSARVAYAGGFGAAASADVVVDPTPLLVLGMTEDRDPVGPGELLMYRLVYGNAGVVALTGVTLSARIPVGTTFDGASGGGVLMGEEVEWTVGSLSVGEVGQQTLTVLVGGGLADGEVLTGYAAIDESAGNAARAAAATAVDLDAELSLTLVASPDPVGPGEQITYEMTVANRGAEDLAGVVLRFLMPDYVGSFFDTDTGGDCPGFSSSCESGEAITFALGTLPAGGSRTVLLGLQVLSGSSSPRVGALIHGSARVAHAGGFGAAASVDVVVDPTPLLVLGVTHDRDPVGPGESLVYRLQYGNAGVVGLTGVTLRVRIPMGTTFGGATGGGLLTGDEVQWTIGSLDVGEVGQQTLTVLVAAGLADGEVLTGYAAIGDSAGNGARATTATVVVSGAELGLRLVASPDPVEPGEQIVYQMTVTNRGAEDLASVVVRLVVPDYVVTFSDTGTGGDCPGFSSSCESGETMTFALGTLPAGGMRPLLLSMTVQSGGSAPPDGSLIHTSASVTHSGGAGASAAVNVLVGSTSYPPLVIFGDGFETGDASAWSAVIP